MRNIRQYFDKYRPGFCAAVLVLFVTTHFGNGAIPVIGNADAQSGHDPHLTGQIKERIKQAVAVQNKHHGGLLRIPDVIGTGTGIGPDGKPVISVFSRKFGLTGIPASLDGIPVRLTVTGIFIAHIDPRDRFDRPVPIGVSSGHPDVTAGTIGARVRDTDGNVYALSNNHVYADQNDGDIGDSILQPGTVDGGIDPEDKIGELFDFEPIDFSIFATNELDAAIAGTTIQALGRATLPEGYGMPNSTIFGDNDGNGFFDNEQDLLQLAVKKFGRSTGLTRGRITEINVRVAVCYANCDDLFLSKLAWFDDQIAINGINSTAFSAGGDSGSLVVTDSPVKQPVALLFAGAEGRTLANRIDLVLDRFDVRIDGASLEEICESDFDGDRDVDGHDFSLFIELFPVEMAADLNADGLLDREDVRKLAGDFGRNACP